MDIDVNSQNDNIRKIEDIIDIQKANGNFNVRQVAFNLPPESETAVSADVAKSLESGLTKSKPKNGHKKFKKLRSNRSKSPLPDVVSWPSDSDITVLRMKLCLTGKDLKDNACDVVTGDGLHQPDSSSMVNLATLMWQSEPPSKQSLNIEEYLLPLTSWERNQEPELEDTKDTEVPGNLNTYSRDFNIFEAMCTHRRPKHFDSTNGDSEAVTTKSRVARFLRLYFCPCCTCLYNLENVNDKPSAYFTK